MSINLMRLAFQCTLLTNATDKLVMVSLADWCDDYGVLRYGDASVPELAAKTSLTERGFQKVILRLEEAGFVAVRRTTGGKSSTNIYRLNVALMEQSQRGAPTCRYREDELPQFQLTGPSPEPCSGVTPNDVHPNPEPCSGVTPNDVHPNPEPCSSNPERGSGALLNKDIETPGRDHVAREAREPSPRSIEKPREQQADRWGERRDPSHPPEWLVEEGREEDWREACRLADVIERTHPSRLRGAGRSVRALNLCVRAGEENLRKRGGMRWLAAVVEWCSEYYSRDPIAQEAFDGLRAWPDGATPDTSGGREPLELSPDRLLHAARRMSTTCPGRFQLPRKPRQERVSA